MPISDFLNERLSKSQIKCLGKTGLAFCAGAVIYSCAELLWRGHTHWTMTLAGGLCTALIHGMNRRRRDRPLALRCLYGCLIISSVELFTGLLVNRLLGWGVWDYSEMRFNLFGQVSLLYCGMWYVLSLPAIALSGWLDYPRKGAIVF